MYVLQDKLETKKKAEIKAFQDTVNKLQEKLAKMRAQNQKQGASTPFRLALPQSEQVSDTFSSYRGQSNLCVCVCVFVRSCC
jgi:hypothetical protein